MDPIEVDVETHTATACSRVPAELLLDIFLLLTPYQRALHACVLTCRRWNRVATPVLWKRPKFQRISGVEKFAASLLTAHRLVQLGSGEPPVRLSPYSRLIETLSFNTLPEPDRNNPHLATLLDTIVNCMAVVAAPQSLRASVLADGSGWEPGSTAMVLKRSRSLSRNEDAATRPHSAAGLPLPDNGECSSTSTATNGEAELGDKHGTKAGGATGHDQSLQMAVDDTQLQYSASHPPLASPADSAASAPLSPPPPLRTESAPVVTVSGSAQHTYTSSLRQLDLRFCKGVRNYSLQRLAPKLATLTVLNLAGGLRTDITIAKLSQHMFQLRRISLAWTSNLTDFGVSELVQRCKSIECLDLTYCTQIEDTAMFAIAHNLHNLTALSVAYCAGVTDIGVREVSTACPRVCVLNVAKCLRVTDRMRKLLEQQRIVAQCDSFEPFSIYNFARKQRMVFSKQA
ncbi:hypothetical protein IWW55_002866 [Coemansia sp. RSA 2706]|nr:hypothetical protein IWW55_002866 [Coemansia sp. RSA 2706]KAJ2325318.1 hypothetical protein IWW51_002848 [Coemansia sp. RSA 2702]KAJ2728632.1 hypothetical protein H4R23_003606 [Coemansia sp. Cherry 401B]